MVADKALDEYRRLDSETGGEGWDGFKRAWGQQPQQTSDVDAGADGKREGEATASANVYSFFSPSLLGQLSHHLRLSGCFALGTVLVLKMAPLSEGSGSGYTSTATASLQSRLLTLLDSDGAGIHSRVLGDMIYFMTSLSTSPEQVDRLGKTLLKALDMD